MAVPDLIPVPGTIRDISPVVKYSPYSGNWWLNSYIDRVPETAVGWMVAQGWQVVSTYAEEDDGQTFYVMSRQSMQNWMILQTLLNEYTQAYNEGYDTACAELIAGTSTTESAKHRGVYPGDQDRRILWDQGYDDAVCAWRLGMEPDEMRKADIRGPSLMTASSVIHRLLDALLGKPTKLFHEIRPDPRKYVEE
jgi:hypothetical protein